MTIYQHVWRRRNQGLCVPVVFPKEKEKELDFSNSWFFKALQDGLEICLEETLRLSVYSRRSRGKPLERRRKPWWEPIEKAKSRDFSRLLRFRMGLDSRRWNNQKYLETKWNWYTISYDDFYKSVQKLKFHQISKIGYKLATTFKENIYLCTVKNTLLCRNSFWEQTKLKEKPPYMSELDVKEFYFVWVLV